MPVEQGLPWHPVATGLAGQAIPFIVAASHAHALPSAPRAPKCKAASSQRAHRSTAVAMEGPWVGFCRQSAPPPPHPPPGPGAGLSLMNTNPGDPSTETPPTAVGRRSIAHRHQTSTRHSPSQWEHRRGTADARVPGDKGGACLAATGLCPILSPADGGGALLQQHHEVPDLTERGLRRQREELGVVVAGGALHVPAPRLIHRPHFLQELPLAGAVPDGVGVGAVAVGHWGYAPPAGLTHFPVRGVWWGTVWGCGRRTGILLGGGGQGGGGERPKGAAKGKQTNTMASCQPPTPI